MCILLIDFIVHFQVVTCKPWIFCTAACWQFQFLYHRKGRKRFLCYFHVIWFKKKKKGFRANVEEILISFFTVTILRHKWIIMHSRHLILLVWAVCCVNVIAQFFGYKNNWHTEEPFSNYYFFNWEVLLYMLSSNCILIKQHVLRGIAENLLCWFLSAGPLKDSWAYRNWPKMKINAHSVVRLLLRNT